MVYVVLRGSDCEGGEILGIYKTHEAADLHREDEMARPSFMFCDWCRVEAWPVSP